MLARVAVACGSSHLRLRRPIRRDLSAGGDPVVNLAGGFTTTGPPSAPTVSRAFEVPALLKCLSGPFAPLCDWQGLDLALRPIRLRRVR